MGNRHPSSFAKRAREAAKRAKKQEKAERKAQRQAEPEEGAAAVPPEHDPDIDWSAAVGIEPPPGALNPPAEKKASDDESTDESTDKSTDESSDKSGD